MQNRGRILTAVAIAVVIVIAVVLHLTGVIGENIHR